MANMDLSNLLPAEPQRAVVCKPTGLISSDSLPAESQRTVVHNRTAIIPSVVSEMISVVDSLIDAYVEIKRNNNATMIALAQVDAAIRMQKEETLRERIRQEEETKRVLEQCRIDLEKERLRYSQFALEEMNRQRALEMQHSQWQYRVEPLKKHMDFLLDCYRQAWEQYSRSGFENETMNDALQRINSMIMSCSEQMQKF